jgi:Ras-related protein Rab-8A
MEEAKKHMQVKLLLLGDMAVGKTSLMMRLTDDEFNLNIIGTAGIDLKKKTLNIEGEDVKVLIYDTAGHERFRLIAKSQYKGSNGIVLIYDITDRKTFDNVSKWMEDIKENIDNKVEVILVGNKIDKTNDRLVKSEEGQALGEKFGVTFFETSAKTGEGVNSAFLNIVKNIYHKIKDVPKVEVLNTQPMNTNKKKKSKCC